MLLHRSQLGSGPERIWSTAAAAAPRDAGGAGAAPQGPAHTALLHPQPLSSCPEHLAAATASLLVLLGLSSLLVRGLEQGKGFGQGDGEWGRIASVFHVPGLQQTAHDSLKNSLVVGSVFLLLFFFFLILFCCFFFFSPSIKASLTFQIRHQMEL